MQIVTITCKDDFDLCLWQLKSIEKFLEPCKINVVVNEDDNYTNDCKRVITDLNLKLDIRVWSQQEILQQEAPHFNGWVTQQLLKLLIPIDSDYICLDCKDIFVKSTLLEDLEKNPSERQPDPRTGQPWCRFFDPMVQILWRHYKIRFNSKKLNGIQTPRHIQKQVVDEIPKIWKDKSKFIKWWGRFGMPSEFILYDSIELILDLQKKKGNCFNKKEIISYWYPEELDFDLIDDNTRIIKIHRRIFNDKYCYPKVKNWLKKILH